MIQNPLKSLNDSLTRDTYELKETCRWFRRIQALLRTTNQINETKPGWPIGINDGTKPSPSKRACVLSGERFTDMDVDLLKSFNEGLAKLDNLDILREDINALCARLEFTQHQIHHLRQHNTTLKGTVDSIHSKVEVVQRENKQLKESLLDVKCRSMRNNLIFSGIPENDNSRGCEVIVRDFMSTELKLPTDVVRNATFSRVHRIGKATGLLLHVLIHLSKRK